MGWSAPCQYTVTVDRKFELQPLSHCDSTCKCLSRSVQEIHWHGARTLSNQHTTTTFSASVFSPADYQTKDFLFYFIISSEKLRLLNHLHCLRFKVEMVITSVVSPHNF